MQVLKDEVEGRVGLWMQTSLGGKFFPQDMRPEEIFISDIANGLALDCRYNGQGRVDRYLSVAEHSVLMAQVARRRRWPAKVTFAVLLHDAATNRQTQAGSTFFPGIGGVYLLKAFEN